MLLDVKLFSYDLADIILNAKSTYTQLSNYSVCVCVYTHTFTHAYVCKYNTVHWLCPSLSVI